MAAWLSAGDMQPLHGAANHKGIKLASSITASIQIPLINPADTIADRMNKSMNEVMSPLDDPTAMRIDAGDLVFIVRENTENMHKIDRNPFSVFNGLLKIPDETLSGDPDKKLIDIAVEFAKLYRFVGVSTDEVHFVQGPLAVDKVDLQIAGIASWVNGSNTTAYPGDLIMCVPDSPDVRRSLNVKGTPGWVASATGMQVVKTRCITCKSVGLYDDRINKMKPEELLEKIFTASQPITKGTNPKDSMRTVLKEFLEGEKRISSLVIGKNYSVVMPGAIGQMTLML